MARWVGSDASITLFDAIIEAAVLIGPGSGKVVLANKAAAVLFGYLSPEAMAGADPLDHIPPEDKGRIAGIMAGYFVEGNVRRPMEVRTLALDGREVWVMAVGVRIDYQGKPAGLILMVDITARKAAESALSEAEERQRRILDNANESILVLQDGNVVYANRRALQLGHFAEDEIHGKPFVEFLLPEDRERVLRRYLRRASSRDYVSTFTVRGVGKDGGIRWSEVRETSFSWEGKPAEICLIDDVTERRKAEESLAASEKRYQLLTDNVSDVIWVADLQLRPTYFNPSITRLLGYSVEEAMAGAMKMAPASLEEAVRVFRDALQREEAHPGTASGSPKMDLEYMHKDGSTVWMETTVSFLRDANGQPVAVLGILHDISERKKTEEALRKSEERFRALIENASDAIAVVDADGQITYESPTSQRNTPARIGGLFGPRLDEVIHPDDVPKVAELFDWVRHRPGESVGAEVRYRHTDGSWHIAEGIARNLIDDPRVNGIVINYRDTTEKRKAEEALRDSEAKYRGLFEGTQTAIQVISMETGRVVLANEAAARMWGFASVDDVIGLDPLDFLQPEDRGWVSQRMVETLAGKRRNETVELRVQARDGRWVWVNGMAAGTEYQGKPALLVSLLDITQRKDMEETLKASEEKYRFLVDNTSDFIWTRDLNLQTTYASPAVQRILGFTPEEHASREFFCQVTPESESRAREAVLDYLAQEHEPAADPQRLLKIEMEYYRKGGSPVWLESLVGGVRDSSGRLVAFHGVSRDITDRRKAERALKESERRYRLLADNVGDVIFTLDMDLRPTYFSPSAARLSGHSTGEIVAGGLEQRMTVRSFEMVMRTLSEALDDEKREPGSVTLRSLELELIHKDGSLRPAVATVSFLRDEEGKPIGIVGTLHDATESKRAEEALRDSERRYRLLAENLSDVIWVINTELEFTYVSPSVERLLGYAVEEAVSLPVERIVTAASLEMAMGVMGAEQDKEQSGESDQGRSVSLELELYRKDGSTVWTENRVSYLRDSNGVVTGYLGVSRDIGERRDAQEALKAKEERFRTLIEQSTDAIAVLDREGRLLYESPSMERITGYRLEEWQGTPVTDWLLHPDDLGRVVTLLERAIDEANATIDNVTARFKHKDGTWHTLEATVRNLLHDPRVGGLLINYRDVTERVKAEEDLRASEERFRTIFEKSPIGAIIYDSKGVTVGANRACLDIFGLTDVADLKGPPLFEDPNLPDRVRRKLRTGKSVVGEGALDLDKAKGTGLYNSMRSGTAYLRLTMTPLGVNREGSPAGYLVLVDDITERKKAEDALRASEERFRGLVEATSDWVWEVDQEGVFTYVSPKVREVLGYECDELVGKKPFDFMPDREANRVAAVFTGFLAKKEPFAFLENVNRHKNGRPVVMETSGVPFFARDGTLLGYRGVDRDITERKRVGRRLQQSLRKLERTMEAIIQAISTTIEMRDPYTAGHQRRVTQLACVIARDMDLSSSQIEGIRVAGLLHDIGKICVPTEILNKPGQLNDVEISLIRTHPRVGYDILKSIEFEWPVADIVVQHHERLDGSGYPSAMKGDEIMLEARILAAADVVEAMSSHRPYRPSMGMEKALGEIAQGKGTLYDPVVVQVCLDIFVKKGFQFEAV